jgi:DNA adenine methylase
MSRSPIAKPKFLLPATKTHGGKRYSARKRIIPLLPDAEVYVEPYAGGLSVLLNRSPGPVEVANDLNSALMRFYIMLRDRSAELIDRLAALEYDRETFEWSLRPDEPTGGELDAAVRFLVRNRFSRGGLGRNFAWSGRLRGGQPGDRNAWQKAVRFVLPRVARRLARVELLNRDGVEIIEEFDGPGTLYYLDPPYPQATRTTPEVYDHEMSEAAHVRLLETIVRCRGMVAISGYANPLYDEALRDWDRVKFDMPNHSGQGKAKQRRVEVLWRRNCGA